MVRALGACADRVQLQLIQQRARLRQREAVRRRFKRTHQDILISAAVWVIIYLTGKHRTSNIEHWNIELALCDSFSCRNMRCQCSMFLHALILAKVSPNGRMFPDRNLPAPCHPRPITSASAMRTDFVKSRRPSAITSNLLDAALIQPAHRFVAPRTIRLRMNKRIHVAIAACRKKSLSGPNFLVVQC